ncbi:Replication initiator protein A (RepA) N-terminus [Butyrivibrio sp. ob235]|uniref:DUF6017 domain-containing protein n=1 Tax=Butyrivibrio sp. ob235 TaxID=1761780 RepID=UPI0008BA3FC0|nr:DUF6017 domain-containing protein [Butyrivibrio sp. ob235]SEL15494.1 Replication initiator protein A (RepA) N-terminus [Butyrivibrio sp. ob235]
MADFEYFYGQEADLFSFIRVPKLLFTDDRFKDLTSDAKILYGLLLDRMSLSVEHEWFDKYGRVYIVFTIAEIVKTLGCANTKACNTLKQLSDVGLIEKNNKGQGKAQLIYVKKILSNEVKCKKLNASAQNENSGNENSENKNSQNRSSEIPESRTQEFQKTECINTENNNTDFINTEKENLISSNLIKIYPPKRKVSPRQETIRNDEKRKGDIDFIDKCIITVHDNIDINTLCERYPYDFNLINQIADLMVDVLMEKSEYYTIGGARKPSEVVKKQFYNLRYEHIAYVIDSLKRNTTDIRNVRQYLIAALYNAPLTIEAHYGSQVQHDMARGLF